MANPSAMIDPSAMAALLSDFAKLGMTSKDILLFQNPEVQRVAYLDLSILNLIYGIFFWEFLLTLDCERNAIALFRRRATDLGSYGGKVNRWSGTLREAFASPVALPTLFALVARYSMQIAFISELIFAWGRKEKDCNALMQTILCSASISICASNLIYIHRAALLWSDNFLVSRIVLPGAAIVQSATLLSCTTSVPAFFLGTYGSLLKINQCFFYDISTLEWNISRACTVVCTLFVFSLTVIRLYPTKTFGQLVRIVGKRFRHIGTTCLTTIKFWEPVRVADSPAMRSIRFLDDDDCEQSEGGSVTALADSLFQQGLIFMITTLVLDTMSTVFMNLKLIDGNAYLSIVLSMAAYAGMVMTAVRAFRQLRDMGAAHARALRKEDSELDGMGRMGNDFESYFVHESDRILAASLGFTTAWTDVVTSQHALSTKRRHRRSAKFGQSSMRMRSMSDSSKGDPDSPTRAHGNIYAG